jgi:hypothetical protein
MRAGRALAATGVTMVAVPVGVWAALVAGLTLVQQVLAGFVVIADASWTQALNPAVWFGWQNVAGNGSFLDSILGGPGAPGGTVNRWLVFMLSAALASACYAAFTTVWAWARASRGDQSPSTLDR